MAKKKKAELEEMEDMDFEFEDEEDELKEDPEDADETEPELEEEEDDPETEALEEELSEEDDEELGDDADEVLVGLEEEKDDDELVPEEEIEAEEKPAPKKKEKSASKKKTAPKVKAVPKKKDAQKEKTEEEKPVPKKSKPKSKEVVVKNSKGDELEAELVLVNEEEFDPVKDGELAREAIGELAAIWIEKAPAIGRFASMAKKFYKGQKEEFEKWLRKYLNLSYSAAQTFIRVAKWNETTIAKIADKKWTSTHVKALPALGSEDQVVDFLEAKTHVIDDEGTRKKTDDMTPDDVQAAVKQIRKETGRARQEPEGYQLLGRLLKKFDKFFADNYDDVKTLVTVKVATSGELTPEEIAAMKNASKHCNSLSKKLDKIIEKLG